MEEARKKRTRTKMIKPADRMFPISEIFYSLQGEGFYTGWPSLFIRLCFCNRTCSFCDTEFNTVNVEYTIEEMKEFLCGERLQGVNVVWTGGEPLMHYDMLTALLLADGKRGAWHIETNGDFIGEAVKGVPLTGLATLFEYVAASPKHVHTARQLSMTLPELTTFNVAWDIKVVTDLETVGVDMLPFATLLMPLTYEDKVKTLEIKKRVAKYCIEKKIRYTPRLQVDIWGYKMRGV